MSIKTKIDNLEKKIASGKMAIATSITNKGIESTANDSLELMATKIDSITGGGSGSGDDFNVLLCETEIPEIITLKPSNATAIRKGAFQYTNSFDESSAGFKLVLPNNITTIRTSAFDSSSLNSINLDNVTDIENYAFKNTKIKEIVFNNPDTTFGSQCFGSNANLTKIVFNVSDINMGTSMFTDCKALSDVTLPNNLSVIQSGSFYNCTALTSITIPESVTSIGSTAFRTTRLADVNFPDNITTIGDEAFYNISSYSKDLILPANLNKIGLRCFYGFFVKYKQERYKITIPSTATITSLPANCFADNPAVDTVEILTNTIQTIASTSFTSNSNITKIIINKPEGSITGAPWGATNATVEWIG